MVAIAISAVDPLLRGSLERLLRDEPTMTLVGSADSPSALLGLAEKLHIDVVIAEAPPPEQLADWQVHRAGTAWVVLLDRAADESSLDALNSGASAILPRSADRKEIVSAIKAASDGLVVIDRQLFAAIFSAKLFAGETRSNNGHGRLTTREIEVLAAMADGASNKTIARRMGISFHTAKFHVAAILEKLDADTRTEAVMKAAQLGIVML